MFKKQIDLQIFADVTPSATSSAPETAENTENGTGAAAAQVTEEKTDEKKSVTEEKKYTDKDLDDIISKKFAKWQEKKQKEVDEAKKLAEMNATQKAEYQRDQLQKELDKLKKENAMSEMMKVSRKMLSEDGINLPDELLSLIVSTDAEETKTAVSGFSGLFKEAVENAVKERLKGEPPRKGSGAAPAAMTKEQIMAIRDPELRQRKMLENKELFNL